MRVGKSPVCKLLIGIVTLLFFSISATRVQAFTNGQNGSLEIGQKDFTSRFSATSQRGLSVPNSAIFDSSGNLWIADTYNNRVLEFQPPFANWENASVVLGHPDFITKTSPNSRSTLAGPTSLAFDPSGNLFVADSLKNRVAEFRPPFTNGEDPSVIIGQKGLSANQIATRTVNQSILINPQALTFNSGNLWVADSADSRILEFVPPFVNGMGASLVIGQPNFFRSQPGAPVNASDLQAPSGVTFDSSGSLWVADSTNNRVLQFKAPFSTGESASLVLGQSSFNNRLPGVSQSSLQHPRGLAFDSSGVLWVADDQNNRVLRFDTPFASGMAATLVLGQAGFTTRTAEVSASTLAVPSGLVFDSSGNLWVADAVNSRVIEFSSTTVPEFPTASIAVVALVSLAAVALVTRKLSLR